MEPPKSKITSKGQIIPHSDDPVLAAKSMIKKSGLLKKLLKAREADNRSLDTSKESGYHH
jgi:hypothetical protein